MTIVLYLGLFFVLVIAWLALDLHLGRKKYVKEVKRLVFPKRHSEILLYVDGNMLFENLYNDMRNATQHIHTLFYIIRDDHVSKEFLSILKDKADQGVEVRLFMDYIGSLDVTKETVEDLKAHNIEVTFYQKPSFPFFFFSLNQRNHRKITVIDGKIGYVGGYNIGKEYLGLDPKFGVWRDYHLKLEGEGVQDLQTQFLQTWGEATGTPPLSHKKYYPQLEKGKIRHQLIPTNGGHLSMTFQELIRKAQKSVIICTPYFIPSKTLFDELLEALSRGVSVTILVPAKADHPLVMDAAFPYYPALIEAGAQVYRFYLGFYHAKVFVVDDNLCDIGTANFDRRSLFLNNEINCLIFDKEFVQKTINEIQKDLHSSEKLTLEFINSRSWWEKGKEQLSKLLSPLL